MAALHVKGELALNQPFRHEGLLPSTPPTVHERFHRRGHLGLNANEEPRRPPLPSRVKFSALLSPSWNRSGIARKPEEEQKEQIMPLIQITQFPGLDPEQKRSTIEAVTAAYARATGKDESAVWVTITEVPRNAWGVGGVPLG